MHPKIEIYHQIMKRTKPFESIMQYHRVYGGLNLILNNILLLRGRCNLELSQVQEIWSHANVVARDTLVFMWCLGKLKAPLGVMEMLVGSPLFNIKRYILRPRTTPPFVLKQFSSTKRSPPNTQTPPYNQP